MADVLAHNPCTSCVGNDGRCSLEDPSEKYNALNCNLLIEWVYAPEPKPLGRPVGCHVGTKGTYTKRADLRVRCPSCKSGIDVLIRGHVHYFVYYQDQDSHAFTSPAFKFPDQHLYRGGIGGTYPSIGAVSVIVEQNDKIQVEKHLMPKNKMPKPEVVII